MSDPTALDHGLPADLESLRARIRSLPQADAKAAARTEAREACLTKPAGALGRLEEISRWLAAWQGRCPPRAETVQCLVFAGNHGVAARGVSAFPAQVTAQMVANFQAGGAAVNQLCRTFGVDLSAHALDLDRPTRDFTEAPAMDEDSFLAAMRTGMEAVTPGVDLVCLGEMGIANTTAAAAVCLGLFGEDADAWTGPGTGVAGTALAAKRAVVARAADLHRPDAVDSLDLLRRLGGRELAAMAGAVLAARLRRVPVLLDGFVGCAAAAPLAVMAPGALDHCMAAHVSAEPGHARLLRRLDKRPLLALDMRLGEASGAVLAVGLIKAAVSCHTGMATFDEAGVADG